jgi:hypothetical protein
MRVLLAAAAALILAAPVHAALDEDDKSWLLEVKPILLDEEAKILESLKTKPDRLEFRKIFWARRDPDLGTPENEFRILYEKRRPEANKMFFVGAYVPVSRSTDALSAQPLSTNDGMGGSAADKSAMQEIQLRQYRDQRERPALEGSLTDCGTFYLVLGPPDNVEKRNHTVWGPRPPQAWTYKAKDSRFLFDEACMLPIGNDKARRQAKEYAIVQPTITYQVKGGELLKRLDEMMPKPSPIAELMRAPRQDFPVAGETYFMKVDKSTGVFGLVRGDASALFREEAAGGKVRLILRAEVVPQEGPAIASEREVLADVDADGAFVASYRVAVPAGPYTLKLGVLDANNQKGTVVTQPLEVPDFRTGELTIAPVLALRGVEETPQKDAKHPMEAFLLSTGRLLPRFGNVFRQSEAITVSYQFYEAKLDAAGKSSSTASIVVRRSTGSMVAQGPDDTFDTEIAGTFVGPMSLARYAPGKYKIELRVTDNVAGKTYTRECPFEVKADAPAAAAN